MSEKKGSLNKAALHDFEEGKEDFRHGSARNDPPADHATPMEREHIHDVPSLDHQAMMKQQDIEAPSSAPIEEEPEAAETTIGIGVVQPGAVQVRGPGADSASEELNDITEEEQESPRLPIADVIEDDEEEREATIIREEARERTQAKLHGTLAQAEEDRDARGRKRRRWIVISVVILLSAVAIALGVTLGQREPPPTPQLKSTLNNVCKNADGPFRSGSSVPGTIEAIDEPTNQNVSCGINVEARQGLWYRFVGSGNSVKAHTCNESAADLDTQISVFAETCENLTCVEGNDDFCGTQSLVSWNSEEDRDYFIFVSSKRTDSGAFTLTFEDGTANDNCQSAAGPLRPDSAVSGTIVESTRKPTAPICGPTQDAGLWFFVRGTGRGLRASTCSDKTNFSANIAVYGGSCSQLVCEVGVSDTSACLNEKKGSTVSWRSELDKLYYVNVHGNSINSMDFELLLTEFEPVINDICDDAPLLSPSAEAESLTLGTTENATRNSNGPVQSCDGKPIGTAGVFYQVRGRGSAMRASVCNNLTMINASLQVYENSCDDLVCVDGLVETENPSVEKRNCEFAWISEGDTFYHILVSGQSELGEFELSISEFELAPNDVCEKAIELDPDDDQITVGSTSSALMNDGIIRNTEGSTFCNAFYYPFAPAVWYMVRGNGKMIEVSTCNEFTTYDSVIVVARGGCRFLTCIDANDDAIFCEKSSTVAFQSASDEIYYIMVTGWNNPLDTVTKDLPPVGDFAITARTLGGALNDECINATSVVPMDGVIVRGSTRDATDDEVSHCWSETYPQTAPGVWFKVKGTGAVLRITVQMFFTDFAAVVSVYEGACSALQCVGEYVETKFGIRISERAAVEWLSRPGESYFIHISGAAASGTFGFELIEVEERRSVPGNGCENAATLVLADPNPALGSAANAASEANAPFCGGSIDPVGVWYRLDGQTEDGIVVTTCSNTTEYDAKISVFSGRDCSSLECVATPQSTKFYSQPVECSDGLLGDTVWWNADASTQYYVLVSGDGEDLSYEVSVSIREAAINDSCEKAIDMDARNSSIVVGSTQFGDVNSQRIRCSPVGVSSPGLWYRTVGTGSLLKASTCSNETSLDTFMTIYSGSCVNINVRGSSLDCVDVNDNDPGCPGGASTVTWASDEGNQYFIYVEGSGIGIYGTFGLTVEEVVDGADREESNAARLQSTYEEVFIANGENDFCANAIELVPESRTLVRGSTSGATVDADTVPNCPTIAAPSSPGVWFKVQGTGRGLQMSTCHSVTTFSTYFQVFETGEKGACDELSCLRTVNDIPAEDECQATAGSANLRKWRTVVGTTYYIVLYGLNQGETGSYGITLEEIDLAPNDLCQEAEVLNTTANELTLGSTLQATTDDQALLCEGISEALDARLDMPGVWYSVLAEKGNAFRASTCTEATDYDTKLSVFRGPDCDSLSCIDINDDYQGCGVSSTVTWKATPGDRYYIQVYGFWARDRIGDFGLSVEEFMTPVNDACESAVLLQPDDVILGSTTDALVDEFLPYCHLSIGTPGVWHKIVGTGGGMRATTCHNMTSFDTRLVVFSGVCGKLVCMDANSDATTGCEMNTDASTVHWWSNVNETYYIHVFGAPPAKSGDFGLIVSEVDIPMNDACGNAVNMSLTTVEAPILGSTSKATHEIFVPRCSDEASRAPGVWFRLLGTGDRLEVSSCTNATTFGATVSVYTGPCDSLTCVDDGVDDGVDIKPCDSGQTGFVVSWSSRFGEQYFLLVHGFGTDVGDFGLAAEKVDPPENDACINADLVDLSSGKAERVGSTYGASVDENAVACGDTSSTLRGVWYQVQGSGSRLRVSTCLPVTVFNSKLSVYSGSCASLTCVTTDDTEGCSTVEWESTLGETYFIFVHGSNGESGSFGLSLEELSF